MHFQLHLRTVALMKTTNTTKEIVTAIISGSFVTIARGIILSKRHGRKLLTNASQKMLLWFQFMMKRRHILLRYIYLGAYTLTMLTCHFNCYSPLITYLFSIHLQISPRGSGILQQPIRSITDWYSLASITNTVIISGQMDHS